MFKKDGRLGEPTSVRKKLKLPELQRAGRGSEEIIAYNKKRRRK